MSDAAAHQINSIAEIVRVHGRGRPDRDAVRLGDRVLTWADLLERSCRLAQALADATIGDHPIGRGDRIVLLYPSANRDEAVFDEPFRFDIRRSPNPHVAFGFGTHLCIGTHVARTTLAAVFGRLSRRITNLRVVAEPDVESNIFARAVRSFRLGFDVR